jgi:hypothetical protein
MSTSTAFNTGLTAQQVAKAAIVEAVKNARKCNRMVIKWKKECHAARVELFEECRTHWIEQARFLTIPENAMIYGSRG